MSEFSEPPLLGLVTRLFRGVKFSINNIHVRVEDDYFAAGKPYSYGLTIQRIGLDTHEEEETRQRNAENSSTIVKMLEVKNIAIYWNSMSEQFVPTSVWDASHDFQYGVFELIPADTIYDMMKDIFSGKLHMDNTFLVDPFSFRVILAFRNSYDPGVDSYKYRVSVVNEKICINIDPGTLKDVMYFQQFMEG